MTGTLAALGGTDSIRWTPTARVEKYSPDQTAWAVRRSGLLEPGAGVLRALFRAPEDGIAEVHGNLLVTVGLNQLTNVMTGGGANALTNANAIIGTGNGVTTATTADTALTADGTANAWYQQAAGGYPTQSNGLITVVSTFTSGNANFTWNEWCAAIGGGGAITAGTTLASVTSTAPTLVNHRVQGFGVKSAGASWIFTANITLS